MALSSTEKNEMQTENVSKEQPKTIDGATKKPRSKILYLYNMIFLIYYHLAGFYGLYLCFTSVKWGTIGFGLVVYVMGILGITAGAHRLWSHKSYKANLPLQITLMVFHCIAFQKTVITWVKIHRLHHKYTDTDLDPHNANRGMFFAHIGWLLTDISDEIVEESKRVDLSDVYSNRVLTFQKKYAIPLIVIFCFALPTVIPMYFWGETLSNAWHVNTLRLILDLHAIFSINSIAHKWGYKPYDKNILSSQSYFVSYAALGEGFHNYHHCFPWDYRAAELGNMSLNLSAWFIDFCSWIGWATDLKTASEEAVKSRAERTGDGTDLWGRDKAM